MRRSRSKLAGHVEPLSHATFQLAQGRSLFIVTQVETIESFAATPRRPRPPEPRPLRLRDCSTASPRPAKSISSCTACSSTRCAASASGDDIDTPVRYLEMQTLDVLGYRPELDECVTCRKRSAAVTNYWTAAAGGVVCPACRPR